MEQYNENKYSTFVTVPSSSRKIVERGTTDVYNTHIHDCSLHCRATCTSMKIDGVKQGVWPKAPIMVK